MMQFSRSLFYQPIPSTDISSPMHIGVEATCWQNGRGYGRHLRSLLTALRQVDTNNHYTLFMDTSQGVETVPPGFDIHLTQVSVPSAIAASSTSHRSLLDMWQMSCSMADSGVDLLLFPTVYSYVPVISPAKKVVMIHDVIAEKYPHLTLPSTLARLFWKIKVLLGRLQADAILTVSDYSRHGIAEHLGVHQDRVFVVGEASDAVFRVLDAPTLQAAPELQALGLRERFIVYVGGFSPHKNLEMLVSVFAKLTSQEKLSDVQLVMVGEYKKEIFHSSFKTIYQQVHHLNIEERVIFTGYMPDEQLVTLLNLATVLILPSLSEGFGLPAVEAAACGCPVIATKESALPSVLGEAALYINPTEPDELASALATVLNSESQREQMRRAGIAVTAQLTWHRAARQLLEVLQRVSSQ
jgi:glycosyltransferase involved in cell wall biosynthesis